MLEDPPICYLCGEGLSEHVSADHVPMKQLFSKEIRRQRNPDLLTLDTHPDCNHAYQMDEEYFIHTFAPVVMDSLAGESTLRELIDKYHLGKRVRLSLQILDEFEDRPSGLHLPEGRVLKRLDGKRINRVLWKIIRGLFFHEAGRFLPHDTPRTIILSAPGEKPPNVFFELAGGQDKGEQGDVFNYRYRQFPDISNSHLLGMLFWNRIIVTAVFHDPECECDKCTGN